MIIPSSLHGVIASSRKKIVVANNDVTPNAITFTDGFGHFRCTSPILTDVYTYTTQQITGINQTISLSINPGAEVFGSSWLCYKIDNTSPTYSSDTSPLTYGFTDFASTISINISNGQYLTLSARWVGFYGEDYGTLTINNTSDSNALLESVLWNSYSTPLC
jgi:hypothetical protein